MDDHMTKARLLAELRAARSEWDALMAAVPEERMTEPGAAGDWSVKDVIAHLTSYDRWFVRASEAHFRSELPPLDGTEGMSFEERNQFLYRQAQQRPLAEVLAESHEVFQRLLEVVEAHTEEFLTQPQQFEGVPEPILVWKILQGDGYAHYRDHMPSIRAWLEQSAAQA
jgi:uncharacterized protein (TIGR03083 family)